MPERLQTEDHRIDLVPAPGRRRPRRGSESLARRPARRRAGADRAAAQAGQQLVVPQHHAAHPRQAAAPAADAPRRPRRARASTTARSWTVRVAGRRGAGRGGRDRRHDARASSRSPTATGTRSTARGCANATKVPGVSINDLTDPELLDVSGQRRAERRTGDGRGGAGASRRGDHAAYEVVPGSVVSPLDADAPRSRPAAPGSAPRAVPAGRSPGRRCHPAPRAPAAGSACAWR